MGRLTPDGRAERIRAITALFDNAKKLTDLAALSGGGLSVSQIRIIADNLAAGLNDILDQEFEKGADYGSTNTLNYVKKNYELREIWD